MAPGRARSNTASSGVVPCVARGPEPPRRAPPEGIRPETPEALHAAPTPSPPQGRRSSAGRNGEVGGRRGPGRLDARWPGKGQRPRHAHGRRGGRSRGVSVELGGATHVRAPHGPCRGDAPTVCLGVAEVGDLLPYPPAEVTVSFAGRGLRGAETRRELPAGFRYLAAKGARGLRGYHPVIALRDPVPPPH